MATRKNVRRKATKKAATRKTKPAAKAPKVRNGLITHTELASADPVATKAWCQKVLGWRFGPPMATQNGDYHMWDFGNRTGGGIRNHNPPETPGSIPYVEVPDIGKAYRKALAAGAREMMSPVEVPGSAGSIAIVMAPGGPAIGFWGPK